jgi:hypothetical protein
MENINQYQVLSIKEAYGHNQNKLSETKFQYLKLFHESCKNHSYSTLFQEEYGSFAMEDINHIKARLEQHKKNTNSYKVYICGYSNKIAKDRAIKPKQIWQELANLPETVCAYIYGTSIPSDKTETIYHVESVIKHHGFYIIPYTGGSSYLSQLNNNKNELSEEFEIIFMPSMEHFAKNPKKAPCMQADLESCGAYAYAFIKQLLSYKQEALYNLSLCIKIEIEQQGIDKKTINLFIPSPSCLRYSQSSSYIKFIQDFLSFELIDEDSLVQTRLYDLLISPNVNIMFLNSEGNLEKFTVEHFKQFQQDWSNNLKLNLTKRNKMTFSDILDEKKPLSKEIEYIRTKIRAKMQ